MPRRLDDFAAPAAIPLVLIEDEGASKLLSRFDRTHILSTRTLLISLERADVIPSARDVINGIAHGGRELSDLQADRTGVSDEVTSAWLGQLVNRGRSIRVQEERELISTEALPSLDVAHLFLQIAIKRTKKVAV